MYALNAGLTQANGEHFTAYNKDELEAHFQRRYEQREQWQLLRVVVNGWDQGRGLLHFGPVIIKRTADDLQFPFESVGKGAYSCGQENFIVLCLGDVTAVSVKMQCSIRNFHQATFPTTVGALGFRPKSVPSPSRLSQPGNRPVRSLPVQLPQARTP